MDLKFWYLPLIILGFIFITGCKESTTQSEKIKPQVKLNSPTLFTPEINSEQSTIVILEWGEVDDVEAFQLNISGSKDFETFFMDSVVESTKVKVEGLPPDTTIYWKVQPYVQGSGGQWSEPWHFKTLSRLDSLSTKGFVAVPEQVNPSDKAEDVEVQPRFEWNEVEGSEKYVVHVSKDDELIINQQADGTSFIPNNKLNYKTTYYWRVKAVSGEWSDVQSFTTTDSTSKQLPAPVQTAPANNEEEVNLKPSFEWKGVDGAESYTVLINHDDEVVTQKKVQKTSFKLGEELDEKTEYSWKVKASGAKNDGEWSSVYTFTTIDLPNEPLSAPTQVAPVDEKEQTVVHPTFKWESVDGAEAYKLDVSYDDEIVIEREVEGVSFTSDKALLAETTYYWRVKAVSGEWSDVQSFTTTDSTSKQLPAPVQTAPANNEEEVNLKPSFEWKGVDGAESYTVLINHDDEVVTQKKVQKTSFKLGEELDEKTEYSWKVRASGAEKDGKWSGAHSFTTTEIANDTLAAPTQVTPSNQKQDAALKPNFNWKAVDGADVYELDVSHGDEMAIKQQVDEDSFTPSEELSGEETYYWRVRAIDGEKNGNWSEIYSFTTTTKESSTVLTNLQSPKDGTDDQPVNVELQWDEVSGASKYKVQLADGEQFKSLVIDKSTEATTYRVSDLKHDESYAWRVEPVVSGKNSKWSEVYTFTTSSVSTPAVRLLSPDDGASGQLTNLQLEWNGLSGISQYRVQVAHNSGFTRLAANETMSGTTYEVSDLDNDQMYYWRVQAASDGDSGNWSEARSFRTEAAPDNGGGITSSDRQVLMELYEATGGDQWNNNSGWGDGAPSNNWHGVEINSQGRVVRLNLFDNGLRGELPKSIGNLSALQYLNVKQNNLSGPVPTTIGSLDNIVYLLLSGVSDDPPTNPKHNVHQGKSDGSGNTFNGRIPRAIGQLSNMEYFELSGSQVTGTIPEEIGNASNLKFVSLSWNANLTGGIPSSIGNLQNLIWFYARASNLDGTIPESLGDVTTLRTLHLGYNDEWGGEGLHGDLPDLSNLKKLRNLNLDKNSLSGQWPNYWNDGTFNNFISLRAAWNNFTTNQLHGFDNLNSLQVFALTGNDISGNLPESITQLHDAKIISLGWTNLSGELPQSGWDFHQLRLVYLNSNNLTGHIPANFFRAADNPNLKWIYLQDNNFTSIDRQAMNSISSPKLQEINVEGNDF